MRFVSIPHLYLELTPGICFCLVRSLNYPTTPIMLLVYG